MFFLLPRQYNHVCVFMYSTPQSTYLYASVSVRMKWKRNWKGKLLTKQKYTFMVSLVLNRWTKWKWLNQQRIKYRMIIVFFFFSLLLLGTHILLSSKYWVFSLWFFWPSSFHPFIILLPHHLQRTSTAATTYHYDSECALYSVYQTRTIIAVDHCCLFQANFWSMNIWISKCAIIKSENYTYAW